MRPNQLIFHKWLKICTMPLNNMNLSINLEISRQSSQMNSWLFSSFLPADSMFTLLSMSTTVLITVVGKGSRVSGDKQSNTDDTKQLKMAMTKDGRSGVVVWNPLVSMATDVVSVKTYGPLGVRPSFPTSSHAGPASARLQTLSWTETDGH